MEEGSKISLGMPPDRAKSPQGMERISRRNRRAGCHFLPVVPSSGFRREISSAGIPPVDGTYLSEGGSSSGMGGRERVLTGEGSADISGRDFLAVDRLSGL